ncbi:hypothetical protein B0H14DRAFT_2981717 [Mycena olivaceomarginata]|nr:hypothetical protein B0H14DRAFT_2981717 [Mycena olivaceomarginata]
MWTLTMAVKLLGKLWLPIGAFTSGMMSTVSPGWTASQTSHSRSHGWNQEILTPQMLLRPPRRLKQQVKSARHILARPIPCSSGGL